jgi:transposase
MLLLSADGWTVPRIATHFHYCQQTVRRLLHRFAPDQLATLRRQHPGPAPDLARRQQVTEALERLLAQERTWTATQLAAALQTAGIDLSTRQVRRYLHDIARWRRTVRSVHHKQDPERVAQAKDDLARVKKGLKRAS